MKNRLKRWVSLFLVMVFCFSLTAVAAEEETTEGRQPGQETEQGTTEEKQPKQEAEQGTTKETQPEQAAGQETGKKTEQEVEEILKMEEEVRKILQEAGIGLAEGHDDREMPTYQAAESRETIYTKTLQGDIGVIDVIDYSAPSWPSLGRWDEGMLGTSDGEQLYCANPTIPFYEGYKTGIDATTYYQKKTVQMIAAMFYYYDNNMCRSINNNYDYLLKQCAVWWMLNEEAGWYGEGVQIETGNNVQCGCGGSMSTHKAEYYMNGIAWAAANYQYFPDAKGTIYEGSGQPLSRWSGKYNPTGTAKLKKVSANPELTTGNPCYSLEGALFGVYSDKSLSGASRVGSFTTKANGESDALTLKPGTYYVRELEAPPGFALDTQTKEIVVTTGKETTVTFADLPQMDPVGILLGKVDAETNLNKPQGSATLQGAQFTVKYYAGLWTPNVDPAALGQKPVRTWVFETNGGGFCYYADEFKVSGDKLYFASTGNPSIPLGTLTIQETKAPEGYLLNPEIFVRQITEEGNAEWVNTYNKPTIPENVLRLDLVKKQEGREDIVIPGAKFEHVKPDGTTETVTTDGNGEFTLKGLQHGEHVLRELEVMDGYEVNDVTIAFTVRADNTIVNHTAAAPGDPGVDFEVTDEGHISLTVEDPLAPFELVIHKENNKERKLAGAEFTLYSDPSCAVRVAKGTTGEDGILRMGSLTVGETYYLRETKAPKGYRLPLDASGNPVTYEIRTESTPVEDEFLFYVDGKAYTAASDPEGMFYVAGTKADRETHLTVENPIRMKLPKTGSSTTLLLMFGAAASGMAAMSCMKKRKEME